jgi:predicted SnoaL-like aldol condensation-catalyzing enzyme
MGEALDTVNRFYDLTNNKNEVKGLEQMLSQNMTFVEPLMKTAGSSNYIEMLGQFVKFHKSWKMLRQFENGDDVCSIYEVTLGTPRDGSFSVVIADWIRISSGKIIEQRIYYDPRKFSKAFGIP